MFCLKRSYFISENRLRYLLVSQERDIKDSFFFSALSFGICVSVLVLRSDGCNHQMKEYKKIENTLNNTHTTTANQ